MATDISINCPSILFCFILAGDRTSLSGKWDYALLRLLWGNALRRNEVSQLNVLDFDPLAKQGGFILGCDR